MTELTQEFIELERRLAELLGTRDVHPDDRAVIREAFEKAKSWDDLPDAVKSMVIHLEQLPRQSWDDPADVPDNLDDDEEDDSGDES